MQMKAAPSEFAVFAAQSFEHSFSHAPSLAHTHTQPLFCTIIRQKTAVLVTAVCTRQLHHNHHQLKVVVLVVVVHHHFFLHQQQNLFRRRTNRLSKQKVRGGE